jgi:hypothetical protein
VSCPMSTLQCMAKAIYGKTGYQQRLFKGLAQNQHAVQQSLSH